MLDKFIAELRGIVSDRAAASRSKKRLKAMGADVDQKEWAQHPPLYYSTNAQDSLYSRFKKQGRSGESFNEFIKREGIRARIKRATSTY